MDIRNAQNSILKGQTRFQKFKKKFTEQWRKPEAEAAMRGYWQNLPEEVRERVRVLDPEAYKNLQQKYGG